MDQLSLMRHFNNLRLRPLRPRQTQAIADIRQAIKEGHKRIILQAPCGFGKTLTAAWLIGGALSKGTRPLFTAPAISLIDQTVKAFEFEGIRDIGVMQAQHVRTDREAQVQVASVQTLIKRQLPEVDFLMLDEIHRSYKGLNEMLDGPWKDKIAIGLTATPWCKGMGLRWTSLIIPATIPQLIEEELLTPTILYVPEQIADRGNIAVQKGEFTEASASQEMRKDRIVGNVVETWKKLGPGDKTFMFCVNLDHARAQMAAFIDSGVPFGYIDAQTPNEERTLQFRKMYHGEIAGVASVGCLIAGRRRGCALHHRRCAYQERNQSCAAVGPWNQDARRQGSSHRLGSCWEQHRSGSRLVLADIPRSPGHAQAERKRRGLRRREAAGEAEKMCRVQYAHPGRIGGVQELRAAYEGNGDRARRGRAGSLRYAAQSQENRARILNAGETGLVFRFLVAHQRARQKRRAGSVALQGEVRRVPPAVAQSGASSVVRG